MIRRLLIFLAVALVWWWVRRLLSPRPTSARSSETPATRTAVMVRDPVCGTFFPRDGALSLTQDGESSYFCSDRCRQTFLEGGVPVKSAKNPSSP